MSLTHKLRIGKHCTGVWSALQKLGNRRFYELETQAINERTCYPNGVAAWWHCCATSRRRHSSDVEVHCCWRVVPRQVRYYAGGSCSRKPSVGDIHNAKDLSGWTLALQATAVHLLLTLCRISGATDARRVGRHIHSVGARRDQRTGLVYNPVRRIGYACVQRLLATGERRATHVSTTSGCRAVSTGLTSRPCAIR